MKKTIFTLLILTSFNFLSADIKEELPIEEVNKIIERAEKKWPNSYLMQKHFIESEMEDLKYVLNMKKFLKAKK